MAEDRNSDTRAVRPADEADARVWDIADTVPDPEIPVLSIGDLGILRSAKAVGEKGALIEITPTYSGCPAMDTIRDDVTAALHREGYTDVEVRLVFAPAWTTDWMTESGRQKLEEYGIAPPCRSYAQGVNTGPVRLQMSVRCPRCGSLNTKELARFASTACKALYQCSDCKEPFDYFKVL